MIAFILRRLVQSVMVMLVVALVSFVLFRYVGDPVASLMGQEASAADRAALRARLGLDQPILVQFIDYMSRVLRGDFGISFRLQEPVMGLILQRLPATLELALVSGLAATISPILAGFAADWFADKELGLTLTWIQSEPVARAAHLPALSFSGLDFLFAISFILGLYAMHRLLGVQEQGLVDDKAVKAELYAQMRRTARGVSSAVGMRQLTAFPFVAFRSTVSRLGARVGDQAGPPSPDEVRDDLPDDGEEMNGQ